MLNKAACCLVFRYDCGSAPSLCHAAESHAQPVIAAEFASAYSLVNLGTPAGVPGPFGGLTIQAGNVNNLLLGGSANNSAGAIYNVGVNREIINGENRITSFSSATPTVYATAPNIDGGLAYGPGGVLFATTFSNNSLLQYLPGSTAPDKIIDLSAFGIAASTGTIQFSPNGGVKIASYSTGNWYDVVLEADGTGTYNISSTTLATTLVGGPEGIVYVPGGSALFSSPAVLVSEFAANRISVYDLDLNENPIVSTRRDFVTGLTGAEGAYLDVSTGDFLFSTFNGNNQVISVRGFAAGADVPEPASLGFALLGLLAFGVRHRKVLR